MTDFFKWYCISSTGTRIIMLVCFSSSDVFSSSVSELPLPHCYWSQAFTSNIQRPITATTERNSTEKLVSALQNLLHKEVIIGFLGVLCKPMMTLEECKHMSYLLRKLFIVLLQSYSGLVRDYLPFLIQYLFLMSTIEHFSFYSLKLQHQEYDLDEEKIRQDPYYSYSDVSSQFLEFFVSSTKSLGRNECLMRNTSKELLCSESWRWKSSIIDSIEHTTVVIRPWKAFGRYYYLLRFITALYMGYVNLTMNGTKYANRRNPQKMDNYLF